MQGNPQSNRLSTIALRASYILPNFGDFLGPKNKREEGGGLFAPRNNQLFEFWGRPFKLTKFH